MAPKHTTPSPKNTSSLKQSILSFKTRKTSAAQSKGKAKTIAKSKKEPREKSESESEMETDTDAIVIQGSESEDDNIPDNVKKSELDVTDKAGIYTNYNREVRKKMGWIPPIHNEGQTKIHNMLRVFDNTYEYGPCVGLTRLQRWERAEAMGLNPPSEVRDILLTKQGSEDSSLVHTVFNGLV